MQTMLRTLDIEGHDLAGLHSAAEHEASGRGMSVTTGMGVERAAARPVGSACPSCAP